MPDALTERVKFAPRQTVTGSGAMSIEGGTLTVSDAAVLLSAGEQSPSTQHR